MTPLIPQDCDSLKQLVRREVTALRTAARRDAGVRLDDGAETGPQGDERAPVCACGGPEGHGHACADGAEGEQDHWGCVCATLPAIPVSAALLEPVRDGDGTTVDFTVKAGNHVRSALWLDAPNRQIGRRILEVQPGAAAGGLIGAPAGVLGTGRPLQAQAVDYTEQRSDGLHRTQLLYDAASCGDKVLVTWRPARNRTELLSLDAQYIASMGWGTWDLLSGSTIWSPVLRGGLSARGIGRRRRLVQMSAATGRPDPPRHR
ncbi:hypothetical protein [Streptomyces sp. NPDC001717]|uniref:hypothetical protein n=1 Tax=Streptomyces sp. NPDC001717 TaxID=3364604 RepID=UPI00368C4E2B